MNERIMVYIGPTLPNIIQTGASYSAGYPPKVAAAVKHMPYLADLMVPAQQLAKAKKEVRNPESALGMIYRRAEKGEN